MKAALEVATIIATITKNAAITECFPPLSPTISPRVTPSETSVRDPVVFVFCQASCFSQKESRRCCCPSDRGHLCLQALARPKTSSQLGADKSNQANFTVSKISWFPKLLIEISTRLLAGYFCTYFHFEGSWKTTSVWIPIAAQIVYTVHSRDQGRSQLVYTVHTVTREHNTAVTRRLPAKCHLILHRDIVCG